MTTKAILAGTLTAAALALGGACAAVARWIVTVPGAGYKLGARPDDQP